MRIPLRDHLESLKRGLKPLWYGFDPSLAIEIVEFPVSPYVWPDLLEIDSSGASPFILLSAPGAMGKSVAARQVANYLGVAYLDLARIRVGSGSLTGELAKSLGFEYISSFVSALKKGETAIVLDGTDEAQLAAGRENFIAFISDLAWLMVDAEPRGQVIVLGRRDATESTQLAFLEGMLQVPRFELAPLSFSQANELIDLVLDNKIADDGSPFKVHRSHPVPFAALRDALFLDVARALDPDVKDGHYWVHVENFLGYPPVVLAFAERLAVDNPAAELAELLSNPYSVNRARRGQILQQVVEQLLDRESGKVRDRLGEQLALRSDDPLRSALYTRDEQAARLLHETGTSGVRLDSPASLPPDDRASYERVIGDFVRDHPFLADGRFNSLVFSDYMRAWAVSSPTSELLGANRSAFLLSLPKAGPFFAHFLYELSNDDGSFVPEALVTDLIHSFGLGAESGNALYVHGDLSATLYLQDDFGSTLDPLKFRVTELSGILELRPPLSRLTVVTKYDVIMQSASGTLTLGPDVTVICRELSIEANVLSVIGGKDSELYASDGRTFLVAEAATHLGDLKIMAHPSGNVLRVSWPDMWHQWKPFESQVDESAKNISRRLGAQIDWGLRRIIGSFRKSMNETPSVSADKMDRLIAGTNDVFDAVLYGLIALGVIDLEGGLYRLHLDALGTYKVSWAAFRGDNPSDSLRELFIAVVQTEPLRQVIDSEGKLPPGGSHE